MSRTLATARDLLQLYFPLFAPKHACGAEYNSRAAVSLAVC